jgi:hypothetical protein
LKRDSTSQQAREIQIAARIDELRALARRMTEAFTRAQRILAWSNARMAAEMEFQIELYRRRAERQE